MGQVVSQFIADYGELLAEGVRDTIIMTAVATLLAYVIGLPVGVLLITSAKKGIRPNAPLNTVLGWIVNIVRSVPFIILLVAIIPLTRLIVGTSLGVPGAIVPLVITAAPFVARVVEQSLAEVDGSLVEAAQSFGASNLQIVFKVLLFESLPSLVRGAALTFITLFGFSAMAGTVGAGGLGDIAIRYGYQRYQYDVMTVAVILCVILVQIVQTIGDVVSDHIDHHERWASTFAFLMKSGSKRLLFGPAFRTRKETLLVDDYLLSSALTRPASLPPSMVLPASAARAALTTRPMSLGPAGFTSATASATALA